MKRFIRGLRVPPRPPRGELSSAVEFTADGVGRPVTWGADFDWLGDVSPAAWIGRRLHPFGRDVGSVIPEGFEAYARLFHPVELQFDRREPWRDVARRNGRIAHREMQFHLINLPRGTTPPAGYHRGDGPRWGTLPLAERQALVEHLRSATGTPDRSWFCVWEGYGGLDPAVTPARVQLPQRNYLLYRGDIERALQSPMRFDQSPNLWWPEDRAWFVATEIDFCWTYVGGAIPLIDALVQDSRLEVYRADLSDRIDYQGDLVNAALNGG